MKEMAALMSKANAAMEKALKHGDVCAEERERGAQKADRLRVGSCSFGASLF
jgi:hypothetical protein